jgi:hypothetical protein
MPIFAAGGPSIALITYEGTFARAEADAKLLKAEGGFPPDLSGGGLAIGNVMYWIDASIPTPREVAAITHCLVTVYHGAPRWPPSLDPTRLANARSLAGATWSLPSG